MAITARIICPSCSIGLRATLGVEPRQVRCPKCGQSVSIPGQAEHRPAAEAETIERGKTAVPSTEPRAVAHRSEKPTESAETTDRTDFEKRTDLSGAWRLARHGLLLLAIVASVMLALFIIMPIATCITVRFSVDAAMTSSPAWLTIGGTVLSIVALGVQLVGNGLLAFTPETHASRKLIFAAIIAMILMFGMVILWQSQFSQMSRVMSDFSAQMQSASTPLQNESRASPEEIKKQTEESIAKMQASAEQFQSRIRPIMNRVKLLGLVMTLVGLVGSILLPIFYGQLAESIKERDLARKAGMLLKLRIVLIGMATLPMLIFVIFGSLISGGNVGTAIVILGVVLIIVLIAAALLFFATLILEIQVTGGLRGALTDRAYPSTHRKKKRRRTAASDK